jgi:hypothetical protein
MDCVKQKESDPLSFGKANCKYSFSPPENGLMHPNSTKAAVPIIATRLPKRKMIKVIPIERTYPRITAGAVKIPDPMTIPTIIIIPENQPILLGRARIATSSSIVIVLLGHKNSTPGM